MQSIDIRNLDIKSKCILFALFVTPLLAWSGFFDYHAGEYIDKSLGEAAIAYASARGINAIVSAAQTAHIDMFFIEATPGEALDPLNDLIERFSAIMLAALGSLALQKILLELVENNFFNIAFTVLAALTAIALVQRNRTFFDQIWKFFLPIFFVRFALILVVFANFWVDSAFLIDRDSERIEKLQNFENDLSVLQAKSASVAQAMRSIELLQDKLSAAEENLALEEAGLNSVQTDIDTQKKILDAARAGQTLCRGILTSMNCSEDVMLEKKSLDEIKDKYEMQENVVSQSADAVSEAKKELACTTKKANGESCSILPNISETKESLTNSIAMVAAELGVFADNLISLLMSFILKTILIPILFLHFLLKAIKKSWDYVPKAMRADKAIQKRASLKGEDDLQPAKSSGPAT